MALIYESISHKYLKRALSYLDHLQQLFTYHFLAHNYRGFWWPILLYLYTFLYPCLHHTRKQEGTQESYGWKKMLTQENYNQRCNTEQYKNFFFYIFFQKCVKKNHNIWEQTKYYPM